MTTSNARLHLFETNGNETFYVVIDDTEMCLSCHISIYIKHRPKWKQECKDFSFLCYPFWSFISNKLNQSRVGS